MKVIRLAIALLLDRRIIASTENAELAVSTIKKHQANPLFGEEKAWEVLQWLLHDRPSHDISQFDLAQHDTR